MNHLRRDLAPLSAHAAGLIESEAKQALTNYLSARKLVEFSGPRGWEFSAVSLGRVHDIKLEADTQLAAKIREVQPLIELRVPFDLPLSEIDDIERGADPDLDAVVDAARRLALAEDRTVFYGAQAAHVQGIVSASTQKPITLSADFQSFPGFVSEAIEQLRISGVNGPYAIALDADSYTALAKTTGAGGYPVLQHVRRFLDGPIVWAPALRGALVLSLRGGDFELVVGQDVALGYLDHDLEKISLYLEESFTFRLLSPEAAVPLLFPAK
ncbi:MAG TPA: family 1 encapsulin nanocompartment shell protein [Polyangiales bacterium]|nr:family 1 encapsulin nanocompartment shell protein [Polyangiales bacterium]